MKNPWHAMKLISLLLIMFGMPAAATAAYAPPATPRAVYNFNADWKFIKEDVPGSESPDFQDAQWQTVSTPHTWNDVDSFDDFIARGGEAKLYMGPARYRKHFKLPADARGQKIILEFEGLKQAAKFWVNGKLIGKYEDGVTAFGLDITDAVKFDNDDNVLAVWITNATDYQEEATGVGFQWGSKDFNPNFGGITRNVRLHVLPKTHQTLPLLNGLGTTGVYVYATDHKIPEKTATINVESEVRNGSDSQMVFELEAIVVDAAGNSVAQFRGESYDSVGGETFTLKAAGPLKNVAWWSPADPSLYTVYTVLHSAGKPVDVASVTTGFRKTAFKGGAGTGGVYINDQFIYLKGYAQRSTNEWAAIGTALPNWLIDFDMKLMAGTNANYVRWMHIAPQPQAVAACDRAGIVQVCPAGDKEANPKNETHWNQRMEVMRRTMILFRNSPSILFWEAGNNGIPANRMQQMVDLRKELDPSGGRVMGCRSLPATQGENNIANPADNDPGAASGQKDANIGVAEYFGVMVGQDARTDKLETPTQMFRAFTLQRRDTAPIIETEDFRDEALRRYWDDFSPPAMGFKKGPNDTYNWNSETFSLAATRRYNEYWMHRISQSDPKIARWSAYASIIWADSNQHGRNPNSEVCRSSGKVDAVRLPKQAYYTYRVVQNEKPDLHILGHWNYPTGTKKTMYVIANHVQSVTLLLNGKAIGTISQPEHGFIYAFPEITFTPGTLQAKGYDASGKAVAQFELKTAGAPVALKLTPQTGPRGLRADGSDIAFFDVEVVDENGERCPTDEARVDFELSGPAIWRGGVNEYLPKSINNMYLNTECGINRVFVRSTLNAGQITLTAKRDGLKTATVTVPSIKVNIRNGLIQE